MRATALRAIENLMKQGGGYQCAHFEIHKARLTGQKKGCCGRTGDDQFIPTCGLINGLCTGLAQCPRLDVKTKSKLIKQWNEDLARKKPLNPLEYANK